MRRRHRPLKWVIVIGWACVLILFILLLSFMKWDQTRVAKTVEPKLIKTAEAHPMKLVSYVNANDRKAYDLILQVKKKQMLTSVVNEYRKDHPPKVEPKPPEKTEKVTEKEQAKKPAPPPPVPKKKIPTGKRIVYLTIDDGPSASTATVTRILNQYHVTATFFMLEPNMRRYPTDLKTLAKDGFGLGLHGVTHDKNKFYQSTKTVVSEMKSAQATLQKITGVKTNLIRVPYGSVPYMTVAERQAEVNAGFIMWDWTIDSRDWDYKDHRYVTSTIQQLEKVEANNESAVILIHDLPTTAKYLPQLLDYLKTNHYELRKIDESLAPVQFKPR